MVIEKPHTLPSFLLQVCEHAEQENWEAIEPHDSEGDHKSSDEGPKENRQPSNHLTDTLTIFRDESFHFRRGPLPEVLTIQAMPMIRSDESPGV